MRNEKIRTSVVGIGYLGRHHARLLAQHPHADLLYAVDIDQERALWAAKQYRTQALFDYHDIPLEHIDAVHIVTPTHTHYDIARYFLENNKHVFIEKPMTVYAHEAQELDQLAKERNLFLRVGHIERFNPVFRHLQRFRGKRVFIDIIRAHPFVTRGIDVDVITDLMVHDLDILLYLYGNLIEPIDVMGIRILTKTIDAASARLQWPEGRVNIVSSRVSRFHQRKWTVYTEGEYCIADFYQKKVTMIRMDSSNPEKFGIEEKTYHFWKEMLAEEIDSFIRELLFGTRDFRLATGEEAYRVLQLTEVLRRKMKPSKPIELLPWIS